VRAVLIHLARAPRGGAQRHTSKATRQRGLGVRHSLVGLVEACEGARINELNDSMVSSRQDFNEAERGFEGCRVKIRRATRARAHDLSLKMAASLHAAPLIAARASMPPTPASRSKFTRARGAAASRRQHVHVVNAANPESSLQASSSSSLSDAEALLLSRLRNVGGRGAGASAADERAIAEAVTRLETDGGLPNPATQPEVQGNWRLLYTSKSKFDIKNPLGSRVDGSAPGIEGFFTSIFGDKAGRGGGARGGGVGVLGVTSYGVGRHVIYVHYSSILFCKQKNI
jgi:hypothetical protein